MLGCDMVGRSCDCDNVGGANGEPPPIEPDTAAATSSSPSSAMAAATASKGLPAGATRGFDGDDTVMGCGGGAGGGGAGGGGGDVGIIGRVAASTRALGMLGGAAGGGA
jgi:hypothetical protein